MDAITALVVIFVVVVVTGMVAFSLYTILFPAPTAADRLESLTAAAEAKHQTVDITGERNISPLEQIAASLGRMATESGESDDETEKLRRLLKHAGFKNRRGVDIFKGVRVAGAMLLPVVLSPLGFFMQIQATLFAMLLGAAAGYYGPLLYVHNKADNRQSELLRSFPDALDLLVSCVDSGLGMDQAFRRVAQEMQHVAPALAREFSIVNSEISAGIDRLTALRHLEERTGLEEVRSLVAMLSQAERFGSSVADTLRLYSSVAREKRMSRAEEKAGQVGSKLTVIMIVFFLPVLMLILLAPSAIRMLTE